jgi:DICT domain-containing protein
MLEGSILWKLTDNTSQQLARQRTISLGVYYKNTLVSLCHALEDCVLTCESQPLMMAAFQRGKWYLQEAERYAKLADKAHQVVIMAAPEAGFTEHPTSQKSNVSVVPLAESDPIAQEWHLVIFGPSYAAMVLCQELSAADYGASGIPEDDLQRKFYGFWTFESDLVHRVMELLVEHIGQTNASLQQQLTVQIQGIRAERIRSPQFPLETVVAQVVNRLHDRHQDLEGILEATALDDNLVSNELQAFLRMAQTMDLLCPENPQASSEVAAIVEMMGQLLDLPAWQLKRLRLAALLHRLDPLQGAPSELISSKPRADYEACPLTCSLMPGVQALRTMPQLRAIAQIITHQTESWDGTGEPAGLAGDDIPLESRILGLASHFQHLAKAIGCPPDPGQAEQWLHQLHQALSACQAGAGSRWDPKLVELLTLLGTGLAQGMSLIAQQPKLANGLWLLDAMDIEPQTQFASTVMDAQQT